MKYLLFSFYAFFLILIVYLSYFFVDPNLSYLQWFYLNFKLGSHQGKILVLFLVLIILFMFYGCMLWSYKKKRINQRDGVVLILITGLILLFAYPAVYSYDIFNYLATAKVAYLYGENPYILMPIEFTGEPLLSFMHAPNKVALYAPGWVLITFIPFIAGAGNFILTVLSFKAVIVLFYFLLLYLIYKISKNFSAVVFFGLNPLVLIEILWSAHNDVVMMAFLLTGMYLYLHKQRVLGIGFFILSFLIKYATIILLPVLFWLKYIRRKKVITQHELLRWSMYGMLIIFLISAFREEIYPWYAIWFLPFVAMSGTRNEKIVAVIFTFCLELRYFPYMISLTHFGMTPLLKTSITFAPVFLVIVVLYFKRIWGKISFP